MLWFHKKNERKEYEAQEFQEESENDFNPSRFFDRGSGSSRSDCCRPGCRCPRCCPVTGPTGPTGATGTGATGATGPTGPTGAIIYPLPLKAA